MALAFDPFRTFFRANNEYIYTQQILWSPTVTILTFTNAIKQNECKI